MTEPVKFPRYFVSTRDEWCIIRFDSPEKCFWLESDHEWAGESKLHKWEAFVEGGHAKEIPASEALVKMICGAIKSQSQEGEKV